MTAVHLIRCGSLISIFHRQTKPVALKALSLLNLFTFDFFYHLNWSGQFPLRNAVASVRNPRLGLFEDSCHVFLLQTSGADWHH